MKIGDSFFSTSNYPEAALWICVGLVCVGYAFRRSGIIRRRCWQAACVFIAFGLSDVVEVRTGAWWRPWWLLAWKGLCVAALMALLYDHCRRRRQGARKG